MKPFTIKRLLQAVMIRSNLGYLLQVYRSYLSKLEAKRAITSLISGEFSTVTVVYDNLVSPPTYGDLFVTLMVCRFFAATGINIKLIFVNGEYRRDWKGLSDEGNLFINEQTILAQGILGYFNAEIIQTSWPECKEYILKKSNTEYVYFEHLVSKRKAVYCFSFNFMNFAMHKYKTIDQNLVLVSAETINAPSFLLPNRPYITFGVRRNLQWGNYNTSDNDFFFLYENLRQRFPTHAIYVVSDKHTCDYFRALGKEKGMEINFCKDTTNSFIEDVSLVLNGCLHFQLNGGGINAIPMFSKIPYFIVEYLTAERMWSPWQLTSWQAANQYFQLSNVFDIKAQKKLLTFPEI